LQLTVGSFQQFHSYPAGQRRDLQKWQNNHVSSYWIYRVTTSEYPLLYVFICKLTFLEDLAAEIGKRMSYSELGNNSRGNSRDFWHKAGKDNIEFC
jgi:hypothetical protein